MSTLTWSDTKGLIERELINKIQDTGVRSGVQTAWNGMTAAVPPAFDGTPILTYFTQAEVDAFVRDGINQAVGPALNEFIGRYFSLQPQRATMPVSGSVFYPATLAGVNPVVGAHVKIHRLDPPMLLTTALNDFTLGTPLAEAITDYQGRFYLTMEFRQGDALFVAEVSNDVDADVFPLIFLAPLSEFLPVIVKREWLHVGGVVRGYRRKNVDLAEEMTRDQAIALSDAVFKLVTPTLVRSHMQQIDHIEYFFIDHKTYIWQLEKKLLKDPIINTLDCVPCPQFQPISKIAGLPIHPIQNRDASGFFQVVAMPDFDISGVNGFINPLYNDVEAVLRPLVPDELTPANVHKFRTAAQLAKYIGRSAASARTSFHFNAHAAAAGPFLNMMTAGAATLFWPVHALMVDIYDQWLHTQFEAHNLQYRLGSRSQNVRDPENPRWHYTEIFTITRKNEIWQCVQRHEIYERHDRLFDPVFDPADVSMCNPLDEDHNEADKSWVHYSHWENRTIGWHWHMGGSGHGADAQIDHGHGTISQPITGTGRMAVTRGGDHDHGGHTRDHHEHGGVSGHSHAGSHAPLVRTAANKRSAKKGQASSSHDLRALSKLVPLENRFAKFLPGLWSSAASGDVLEEKAVTLIHCAAVSLKTTTDLVTGRVILLAKDTDGKLCLLRPVLDDCGKCVTAKFTCHHLPFGEVEDYDLCMKADGTLRIAYIPAKSGRLTVRAESAYHRNDFEDIVYHKDLSWALFQVELIKDANGLVHAFSSNQRAITDIPDKKARLPKQELPCDSRGTLFHGFERSNGDWDTDRHPVSKDCITTFALALDTRNGGDTIHVSAINTHDGQIYVTSVPGEAPPPSAPPCQWSAISQPDTGFFYLCSTRHQDGTPQLFAIDSTGEVFQSKKMAGANWANMARLAQRPIMQRQHRGIMAELDYTGCLKVFVHADDNFVYTCEQEQPNGETYIGWMNV